jgi:putative transposase
LKSLEGENVRLKKLLAEATLDNAMLKDLTSKNGNARRQAAGRCSPLPDLSGEAATGVPGYQRRPQLGALSQRDGEVIIAPAPPPQVRDCF